MSKVTPFLWFDNQAEDAARFYVSLFPNSEITGGQPTTPGGPPLTVSFKLDGVEFIALNGGPHFKLNEAFSWMVACESQAEIDHLWAALPAGGGREKACGWVEDAWGVSWQIIPAAWFDMIRDPDAARVQRVFQALWQMTKLDLAALRKAYDGA